MRASAEEEAVERHHHVTMICRCEMVSYPFPPINRRKCTSPCFFHQFVEVFKQQAHRTESDVDRFTVSFIGNVKLKESFAPLS